MKICLELLRLTLLFLFVFACLSCSDRSNISEQTHQTAKSAVKSGMMQSEDEYLTIYAIREKVNKDRIISDEDLHNLLKRLNRNDPYCSVVDYKIYTALVSVSRFTAAQKSKVYDACLQTLKVPCNNDTYNLREAIAARVLGDLGVKEAVPHLKEAEKKVKDGDALEFIRRAKEKLTPQ